jgi:hydrogenase nickel incorporation protein HypA/HybF
VHEIGYCEGLVDAVQRRAGGRPVARIGVRAGVLHRIVPSALQQSFELVAAGTSAEGAVTDVVLVPATGVCTTCGNRFETADPSSSCPSCGGFDVDLAGGDEFVLAWIEYRDPAATSGLPPEQAGDRVLEHTHERT